MNEITESKIRDAAIEALYWWNRDEFYYHTYFKNFAKIYLDKELLKYFTSKIFEIFLREYSIRRNISKGYEGVDNFISEIGKEGFFNKVKQGKTNVIDQLSESLLKSPHTLNKQTRSLLSKIAFLINPDDFSLYDTLAKKSLWHILKKEIKISQKKLESYSEFTRQIADFKSILTEGGWLKFAHDILNETQTTEANEFLKNHPKAFELRVIDKLLWLKGQEKNNPRKIQHNQYFKLLQIK